MTTLLYRCRYFLTGSVFGLVYFHIARIPRFQVVAKVDKDLTISVQQINAHHDDYVCRVEYITEGLDRLLAKGYAFSWRDSWFTPNTTYSFHLGDKTVQQFFEDCKACDVKTEVSIQYELPFLSGIKERKETLAWSKARCKLE